MRIPEPFKSRKKENGKWERSRRKTRKRMKQYTKSTANTLSLERGEKNIGIIINIIRLSSYMTAVTY